jgi:HEAT repeat protein
MTKEKAGTTKYTPFFIVLILFLLSAGFFPLSKDNAAKTEVEEIVAQFPAENINIQYRLAADIFSLGSKAVTDICMAVAAPGEDQDTAYRYALSGMAVYAGRIENEKERRMFVDSIADAIKNHPQEKAKPFLIYMLELTGRRDAVKILRRCLQNPELCSSAARALQSIGSRSAKKALRQALSSASASCRIPIIKHLGETRDQKAVKKIIPYASHSNPELRQTALFALANSGSPEAKDILLKSNILTSPRERAQAPHLLLLYTRRLAEDGRSSAALDLANKIMRNYRAPQEAHISAAALSLVVDMHGQEAMEALLEAADHPSLEMRGQAYRLAAEFPGVDISQAWIQKAEASPPLIKAEVLTMLADRGDAASKDYIHKNLKAENTQVRQAALKAAAVCPDEKMLPDLMNLLHRSSEDDLASISQALLRLPADSAVSAAAAVFTNVSPEAQAALLGVLSARHARVYADLAFRHLQSENDTLSHTAFSSLEHMVSASDMDRLVELMFQLEDTQKITQAQRALAASANQIPQLESRAGPILKALEKAEGEKRIDFLQILSEIGGRQALRSVLDAYHEDDLKLKSAAVYTLSEWPDFTAVNHLLQIVQETSSGKNRYLAMRGYTRLVTDLEEIPSQKADWMKKIIDLPQNDAEAKIVLSGLSQIKSRESLSMAEQFFSWSGLERETARTIMQIILPTPEKEGMQGEELIPFLQKTLDILDNDYDRERISRYMETLQSARARVTARISRAPDSRKTRPHSLRVAPVV